MKTRTVSPRRVCPRRKSGWDRGGTDTTGMSTVVPTRGVLGTSGPGKGPSSRKQDPPWISGKRSVDGGSPPKDPVFSSTPCGSRPGNRRSDRRRVRPPPPLATETGERVSDTEDLGRTTWVYDGRGCHRPRTRYTLRTPGTSQRTPPPVVSAVSSTHLGGGFLPPRGTGPRRVLSRGTPNVGTSPPCPFPHDPTPVPPS